jgi:hypothetical protein
MVWAVIVALALCAAESCEVPVSNPTPSPLPPGSSVAL